MIAEIKKASPSKGLIRADFDVARWRGVTLPGGAAALSVLTDEPFFQGSLRNLELASAAVPLPCLRKDFIVDAYQIAEARAHHGGCDSADRRRADDAEMKRFSQAAHALALDVLVEVHTAEELDRVLDALGESGADAIGVNNRNLKTFEVRLETSLELVERIPASVVRVTESGIATPEDLARLRAAGFDAFSDWRKPDAAARPRRGAPGAAGWSGCDEPVDQNLRQYLAGRRAVGGGSRGRRGGLCLCAQPAPRDGRASGGDHAASAGQRSRRSASLSMRSWRRSSPRFNVCGLTGVQLHLDADAELPARLRERLGPEVRVLRVVHFSAETAAQHAAQIAEHSQNPHVDAVLVDSRTAMAVGGTGVAFDWVEARKALSQDAEARSADRGGRTESGQCGRGDSYAASLGRGCGLWRGSRAGTQRRRQGAGVCAPRQGRKSRSVSFPRPDQEVFREDNSGSFL